MRKKGMTSKAGMSAVRCCVCDGAIGINGYILLPNNVAYAVMVMDKCCVIMQEEVIYEVKGC